ncbi:methenyltetrahydrofolate cyclohydrolase-like protein [Pseudomonas sp. ATCC 13867]|uniref:ImmA/IrrE family metallo-endopeptidase n=1 Tax=Pseudomonas sp. ATCC 13867 TaxID=1294143 RepID=UPI0002C4EB7D|nr:ImmA/IrrE family metallo-endopeptidase [Pseudomonas sp. ATCC 13867]AGI24368.1 methenyltetrahydrofolate cyclohydrolase-like protein [Pseudomonas sp. ATCC 13867]RFQ21939.1 ImmA/IrrE family metallo-endopeptidase [Pseudomonas sp. ATCC 13867]
MGNSDEFEAADWLQHQLWDARKVIWPNRQPSLKELLDPGIAAEMLGIDFRAVPNLGQTRFNRSSVPFRTAGILDRQRRLIAISQEFAPEIQRFTAAHELGHWLLHDHHVMHRDRPMDGAALHTSRPKEELEADRFATFFLMPAKAVRTHFQRIFRVPGALHFTDVTCFHLSPRDPNTLLYAEESSLERELAVAGCSRYADRRFNSLASEFGVSVTAMAIRIKELGLTRWP